MEQGNEPKVKILVCCHKPGKWLSDDIYMPIQCGKAISDVDLGIQGDDTGDNISAKNPYYCELTAMYWAWKNLKDVDYIGLCHYRRYFDLNLRLESVLAKKDIVLSKPVVHNYNNEFEFVRLVSYEDLYILLDTLLEMNPQYKDSIVKYLYKSNHWIPCNMFIMDKHMFDDYCNFLFPLLFKTEDRLRKSGYTRMNRSLAYMGELLLGVFCYYKRLNIFYSNIYISDQKKTFGLSSKIGIVRRNASFLLGKSYKTMNIPTYGSVVSGLRQDNIKLDKLLEI